MPPRFSIRRNRALTLVEVLVVIAVVVVFIGVFFPALAAAERKSQRIACVNNLKEMGVGFRLWEGNHNDRYPMQISATNGGVMELIGAGNACLLWQTMSNELRSPKNLWCPADTKAFPATNFSIGFSDTNISYFVNPDAVETYPQMIMLGDDNLLVDGKPVQPGMLELRAGASIAWAKDRHRDVGNLGMADGSAQQTTSAGLNSAMVSSTTIAPTNVTVNRWLIP